MPTDPARQMLPADGTLGQADGRYLLRFERRFAHPVERVWDALTRPERLIEWFGPTEVELELVKGGRFHTRGGSPELVEAIIAEHGDVPIESRDTVLRVEPPYVFEHTFGGDPSSIVRWELHPDADGCVLRLTHTEPPGFPAADAPRDLAGWHVLLELLGHALDGHPIAWPRDRWEQHRDRYVARRQDADPAT